MYFTYHTTHSLQVYNWMSFSNFAINQFGNIFIPLLKIPPARLHHIPIPTPSPRKPQIYFLSL